MATLAQLRKAVFSPQLLFRQINKIYFKKIGKGRFNENGCDFFEQDWDNLIILDACRFDVFSDHKRSNADLDGKLEKRVSRGSATYEFLNALVSNRELHDVVYVTGNPQLSRIEKRGDITLDLHAIEDIWLNHGWNESLGTVMPETTTDKTLEAASEYPNKRLVAHYMQPHYPFLSSNTSFDKGHLEKDPSKNENFWHKQLTGDLSVDAETIWKNYQESLNQAMREVHRLLDGLDGKTVITSDHGNMIGERSWPIPIREWGHPRHIHTKELVEVPWYVHPFQKRRKIVAEKPRERIESDQEVISERLQDLGYRDV